MSCAVKETFDPLWSLVAKTEMIEDHIREFVLKHFPSARRNGLLTEEKWLENGTLDSLGILDLVHFLENEFSIQISDEDLLPENFQSLHAVIVFVSRKSAALR
jgi:acyl carrier protein